MSPAFVLELYPSQEQRGVAGRFIAEARETRRSGAGIVSEEDEWMLESLSLPGGMNLPRLRWRRKQDPSPRTAAHLAVAFDTFESRVVSDPVAHPRVRVLFLRSACCRSLSARCQYALAAVVQCHSGVDRWGKTSVGSDSYGTAGPAAARDSEVRVAQPNSEATLPALQTEISPEKAYDLRELHRLCDWVITLDRNAGIEYFDSPRDNKEIYDAYVIDCVPEREDLGCLQLITSTAISKRSEIYWMARWIRWASVAAAVTPSS